MQKQLGVDSPDFGMLFADMALGDGEEVALGKVMQPKVEAESRFVLEKDLPHDRVTLADVISAVAYALPAIEIVGSRIANWNIKLLDTIADNASSGLFVLGARTAQARRARSAPVRHGRWSAAANPASVGAGAACLGNPLNAALWLARTMVEVGPRSRPGDVIMSGALGPMVTVAPAT